MTHKTLPSIQALEAPIGAEFSPTESACNKWAPVQAANSDDKNTINIYDQIGLSWDGTGMTSKIVNSVLRRADGEDVIVNINSPGGDFFEGVAIYNMLREYKGTVDIKIIGLAASAASVIAMAADDLQIAKSGFMMIHNSWGLVVGNQNDMRAAAETFAVFDEAMSGVYSDRSGKSVKEVSKLMDADTWMSGQTAVDDGFADSFLSSDEVVEGENKALFAKSKVDRILAENGMPRSARRDFYSKMHSTQNAADLTMQNAGSVDTATMAGLSNLLADMKRKHQQ